MIAQNFEKPLKNIYWNYYLISVCWNILSNWAFCWRYPYIIHQNLLRYSFTMVYFTSGYIDYPLHRHVQFQNLFDPFHKYRVMDCYNNIGWEWCVWITHHNFGSSKPIIHNKILKRKNKWYLSMFSTNIWTSKVALPLIISYLIKS